MSKKNKAKVISETVPSNKIEMLRAELAAEEIKAAAALVAKVEAQIKEINMLPERLGCDSISEVMALIKKLMKVPNQPRGKITPELQDRVSVLCSEGKTIKEIASLIHLSAPSVQKIRNLLGLTKHRVATT